MGLFGLSGIAQLALPAKGRNPAFQIFHRVRNDSMVKMTSFRRVPVCAI
jgi:hypothetical protein